MTPPSAAQVFVPFALGYFVASLFRPIAAVIGPNIVEDLGVSATSLGLLTSALFIAAAASQLPLGILLDRYGPRLVNGLLLQVTACGALLFAIGDNVATLAVGRALIGIGIASCMASAFKAFAQSFPSDRLPFMNGLGLAAGGAGMAVATLPVEFALQYVDWRGVHLGAAGVVSLAGLIVLVVAPPHKRGETVDTFAEQLRGLRTALSSLEFWRVAPLVMASMGAYGGIMHLWAGPWLRDVGGYDRSQVALTLLLATTSAIFAFPLAGNLSSKVQRYGVTPMTFVIGCMTIFTFVQAALMLEPSYVRFCWLLFGIFGPLGLLAYAPLNQVFPTALIGRVNTSLTLLWMAAAFAVQIGFGVLLDQCPLDAAGGYSRQGYQAALAALVALQVIALSWYMSAGRLVKQDVSRGAKQAA